MREPFVFDPRHPLCKTPFGAAVCGSQIALRCRPLAAEGFTHCALILQQEFSGLRQELKASFSGIEGDRACFALDFSAPAEPELVWYAFRLWRDDGSGCMLDKTGYRSDGGWDPWQLTVYQKSFSPTWFGQGITYQIFPDRFCRLEVPSPEGLVGERWVHQDWAEAPAWRPEADGEVRNRDFFGGSLQGIVSKLPYLKELGVTTLYLCPIFESASNHRYNTADYTRIDPMLGDEEDFKLLCREAGRLGMRVLLDGVFNHTGSQSRYFNADGFYSTLGAAQSTESPYYYWYSFHPWPEDYDAWWGIKTLPAVREEAESYLDYIIDGPDSVVRRWLRAGASGWRLDVADELPDWFIRKIRAAAEETKPDAVLLGEVWEDASNKIAYSKRRKYLLGDELHGVMNYPFRTALLAYLQGGDADGFREAMETLRENYPPAAFSSLMNFLGTHDTPRILTVLGADRIPESKEERAIYRLSPAQRQRGLELVRLAALVLFTFPGSPTVYYGDEIGLEGWEDPFNRGTYSWESGDRELLAYFQRLGALRRSCPPLREGSIQWLYTSGPLLIFARELEKSRLITVLNASDQERELPLSEPKVRNLLTGAVLSPEDGRLRLPPRTGLLLTEDCPG